MNKKLLEIYGLSVCFISTACLTIFSGILLYSLVEIAFPSFMQEPVTGLRYYPAHMPSSQNNNQVETPFIKKDNSDCTTPVQRISHTDYTRSLSIKSIIRSLIVIFVTSLVYFIHWRLAKNARNDSPQQ
ncbi:MAG: hypothetical protein PSN04_09555 [Methyloprofundus sp.]|nr:hypothetical protein [Methyloprofundus sp.]